MKGFRCGEGPPSSSGRRGTGSFPRPPPTARRQAGPSFGGAAPGERKRNGTGPQALSRRIALRRPEKGNRYEKGTRCLWGFESLPKIRGTSPNKVRLKGRQENKRNEKGTEKRNRKQGSGLGAVSARFSCPKKGTPH